jgi:hypothetical protein
LFSHRITLGRENPSDFLPRLLRNELVEAEVVESYSSNTALLLIKGKRLIARTSVPLPPGKMVALRVEETAPLPVLRLIGLKAADPRVANLPLLLSAIDTNIWQSVYAWALQNSLQSNLAWLLQRALKDWRSDLSGMGPESLKEMLDRSGYHWEAKLGQLVRPKRTSEDLSKLVEGDLKGETIRAMAQGEGGNPLLRRLLAVIEEVQILNLGLLESGKLFLPIPLEFPDGWHTVAQLLIHLPRRREDPSGKEEKRVTRITLLLNMSGLGCLRIQMTIMGKNIEGVCMTGSEETRAYLERNISSFLEGLGEKGFSVRSFACILKDLREVERNLLITGDDEGPHSFDSVV